MSELTVFTSELAMSLIETPEQFPIDFEDAWQWLGYSKKQSAKEKLVKNFEKETDYVFTQVRVNPVQQESQENQGGRPSELITLSLDCFKSLGMMAGTEQGKMVRNHFLNCEKKLKAKLAKPASHLALAELMLEELKQHEQRLTAIELENIELKKQLELQEQLINAHNAQLESQDYRVESVEMLADANADELSRFKNGHGFYYSVIGYAAKHEIKNISTPKAAAIGRRATALCKKSGISPERVNDTRYGFVNTYPEHILTEVF